LSSRTKEEFSIRVSKHLHHNALSISTFHKWSRSHHRQLPKRPFLYLPSRDDRSPLREDEDNADGKMSRVGKEEVRKEGEREKEKRRTPVYLDDRRCIEVGLEVLPVFLQRRHSSILLGRSALF
jgi:hypothetical protein